MYMQIIIYLLKKNIKYITVHIIKKKKQRVKYVLQFFRKLEKNYQQQVNILIKAQVMII